MSALVLGEFDSGKAMLLAARRVRELGFSDIDGYTPYSLEGMEEAIGVPRSRVPLFVLIGGMVGASFAYLMMWWCNAVDYPINVGGRPLNSYPAFVPITFELMVLFAAAAAMISMFALAGLPKPYHPVFDVEAFRSASNDRFWLSVRVEDANGRARVFAALEQGKATQVTWVEMDEDS
jgi:hypothetical protein